MGEIMESIRFHLHRKAIHLSSCLVTSNISHLFISGFHHTHSSYHSFLALKLPIPFQLHCFILKTELIRFSSLNPVYPNSRGFCNIKAGSRLFFYWFCFPTSHPFQSLVRVHYNLPKADEIITALSMILTLISFIALERDWLA